jgi:GT2 family glycosyltransferase
MIELQRLLFPNHTFNCPQGMYLKYKEGAVYTDNKKQKVFFEKGKIINTGTFYNAFSIDKWVNNTSIRKISIGLVGNGRLMVRIINASIKNTNKVIKEEEVELQEDKPIFIDIPNLENVGKGLLFYEILTLSDGWISSGGYFTNDKPINKVKLGLVITHFNRQSQVQAASQRIQNELFSEEEFKRSITLTIVDNSRNSGVKQSSNVFVTPNKNYGGSGGFARGLLSLANSKEYTHCLFMDDDASCEIESIRRTYWIMTFATTKNLAIAGSLFLETDPKIIFEKGAIFNLSWNPLKKGLNTNVLSNLTKAEFEDVKPNYGAWWFFCFLLNDVKYFPFPFFVRGDDITFSLMHKFNILTMNGIASFGDDFGLKSGALTLYLDLRSHLIEQIYLFNHSRINLIQYSSKIFLSALFSYNYGTTRAVCLAMADFASGSKFFIDNMDMQNRFKILSNYSEKEKMNDINRSDYPVTQASYTDSKLRRFIQILTLNGNLLPEFLLKEKIVFQNKEFRASFKDVFRFKKIYYEYTPIMKGYVAEYNRKEFYSCLFIFLKMSTKIFFNFKKIKKDYFENIPKITTKDFWEKIYKDP